MQILFPTRPGPSESEVDPSFEQERDAAVAAGFEVAYVGLGVFETSFRYINVRPGPTLYRGWLLKSHRHDEMNNGLLRHDAIPVTMADAYHRGNELPRWYGLISAEGATPKSIWFNIGSPLTGGRQCFQEVAKTFGPVPVLLKDWVKSRKHEWFDACFIRDASDMDEMARVSKNFQDLQGEELVGGLVFRKFETLTRVGTHPKSKLPLVNEYRAFLWHGKVMVISPYWSEGATYVGEGPDPAWIERVTRKLHSGAKHPYQAVPFFTVDVATREDGSWCVIEVGDGGTSGLPPALDPLVFYKKLASLTLGS